MTEHEENWRSYPIESEETMGFTMTDLGWSDAPPTHPWCLRLSVELVEPGPEGLGGVDEMEELSAGEDKFLEAIAATEVIHVARVRLGGEVAWFIYAQTDEILESLGNAAAEALQRDVSVGAQHDPEWNIYASILPSPAVERWIADVELVGALEDHGDELTTPREVRHFVYFEEREEAQIYATTCEIEGFATELTEPDEDNENYGVILKHQSPVDLETITEITQRLADEADEADGEYDGWECEFVKGSGGTPN